MSEQKHTPGPWYPDANGTVRARPVVPRPGVEDERVASRLTDADARRIAACVNACEGLTTEQLERFPLDSFKECAQAGGASTLHELEIERQRDDLLAALVYVEERLTRSGYPDGPNLATIRAAIAKCKT